MPLRALLFFLLGIGTLTVTAFIFGSQAGGWCTFGFGWIALAIVDGMLTKDTPFR